MQVHTKLSIQQQATSMYVHVGKGMLLGGAIGRFGRGGDKGRLCPSKYPLCPHNWWHSKQSTLWTYAALLHQPVQCWLSKGIRMASKRSPTTLGLPYTSRETRVPAPRSFELQTRLWEKQFLVMYWRELGNGTTLAAFPPELKPVPPIPCTNYILSTRWWSHSSLTRYIASLCKYPSPQCDHILWQDCRMHNGSLITLLSADRRCKWVLKTVTCKT